MDYITKQSPRRRKKFQAYTAYARLSKWRCSVGSLSSSAALIPWNYSISEKSVWPCNQGKWQSINQSITHSINRTITQSTNQSTVLNAESLSPVGQCHALKQLAQRWINDLPLVYTQAWGIEPRHGVGITAHSSSAHRVDIHASQTRIPAHHHSLGIGHRCRITLHRIDCLRTSFHILFVLGHITHPINQRRKNFPYHTNQLINQSIDHSSIPNCIYTINQSIDHEQTQKSTKNVLAFSNIPPITSKKSDWILHFKLFKSREKIHKRTRYKLWSGNRKYYRVTLSPYEMPCLRVISYLLPTNK